MMEGFLRKVLNSVPNVGLQGLFGYGSAIMRQLGNISPTNMVDVIFIVDNPQAWHTANLQVNPGHYQSYYRWRGGAHIAKIQDSRAARVYFNTEIPFDHRIIKYGVISRAALLEDLQHWRYLYIAGRLQKPVLWILPGDEAVQAAYQKHLKSTLALSLLLMPTTFSEYELFHVIASLSYGGDILRKAVENPEKVDKIVTGQMGDFRKLYGPHLHEMAEVDWRNAFSDLLMCNSSVDAHSRLLAELPLSFLQRVHTASFGDKDPNDLTTVELCRQLAESSNLSTVLHRTLIKIIGSSASLQSFQNFLTAGLRKSFIYTSRKLSKKFS